MLGFTKCINTISRCTMMQRSEQFADVEINGYSCSYILQICRNPGISQDALAQAIYIHKSNVTRQLSLLEDRGFVLRKPSDSDHRVVEVYPTDKALAILPRVRQVVGDWNDYLTEELSDEEKTTMYALLERVSAKAKRYVDGIRKD